MFNTFLYEHTFFDRPSRGVNKDKAKVIAEAAGLSLKRCLKVDFKPFTETIISNSNLNEVYAENSARFAKASSASEVVSKTFIPEDIQVSQTLYSLWLAE